MVPVGKPTPLISRGLSGWRLRGTQHGACWSEEAGVLSNKPPCVDIISDGKYQDFKLHVEVKVGEHSNSGVYLRGRYEVQVLDPPPEAPLDVRSMGGVYGFLAPLHNGAKKAGEWQSLDVTLLGRKVTVVLDGQTVVDGQDIPGITGGALDSDEVGPGSIMLQGDHGAVSIPQPHNHPRNESRALRGRPGGGRSAEPGARGDHRQRGEALLEEGDLLAAVVEIGEEQRGGRDARRAQGPQAEDSLDGGEALPLALGAARARAPASSTRRSTGVRRKSRSSSRPATPARASASASPKSPARTKRSCAPSRRVKRSVYSCPSSQTRKGAVVVMGCLPAGWAPGRRRRSPSRRGRPRAAQRGARPSGARLRTMPSPRWPSRRSMSSRETPAGAESATRKVMSRRPVASRASSTRTSTRPPGASRGRPRRSHQVREDRGRSPPTSPAARRRAPAAAARA